MRHEIRDPYLYGISEGSGQPLFLRFGSGLPIWRLRVRVWGDDIVGGEGVSRKDAKPAKIANGLGGYEQWVACWSRKAAIGDLGKEVECLSKDYCPKSPAHVRLSISYQAASQGAVVNQLSRILVGFA
jgi:hypothetical protein